MSVGIIAEYNPFHNGHKYHLEKVKEMFKEETIILVMPGNFVQRGEPAIIDKWERTNIAIEEGIDLVVELPFPFATQSADYYSYGAITLLNHLKVDKLVFGSECNNIKDLEAIVDCELKNKDFDQLVKFYGKCGYNYPTSLSLTLKELTNKEIKTPNDILGITYIKTIKKEKYKITPYLIKRTNSYHEKELQKEISSATAIRKAIIEKKNIDNQIPISTKKRLKKIHQKEDYFPFLKYKIITEENLTQYLGVDQGLQNSLKKEIEQVQSIQELIEKCKRKRNTQSNISRALLHILCNYTKEENKKFQEITYIRLLGMNQKGKKYLNQIKKEITIPIISKITREKDLMLEKELQTTKIYTILEKEKEKREYVNHILKV